MNKTQNKFNFKAFIMLLTALVLSLVFCFASSCGNSSSESTSESESESESVKDEVKDEQMIANGNFEYHIPDSTTKYPYSVSSSVKWTRTSYGTTKSSGIIDTTSDDYPDYKKVHRGEGDDHKKVLMLANDVNSDGDGAAQYVVSSTTVTAEYGADYLLTVYVRTDNVAGKYVDGNAALDTGAYIEVRNTVGTTIDSTIIDNIDTKGEWKMYSIYLRPSNIAATKYQVVLGFGHGNSDNKLRGCSGTAYFDDVKMEKLDNGKYDEATATETVKLYNDYNTKKTEKGFLTVDAAKKDASVVKADFAKATQADDVLAGGAGAFNKFNLNNKNDNEGYEVGAPENGALTIDFSKTGREYGSSYSYTTVDFNLKKYVNTDKDATTDYKGVMVSFTANVDAKSYSKNASVKVMDNGKENGGFDSFATDGKDVRYAIYLTTNRANEGSDLTYSLKITFGPTAESSTNTDFPVGKAIFKDFKIVTLTEEEFDAADTSNNGTKVTLLGDYNSDTSEDKDDDTANDSYDVNTNDAMYDPSSTKDAEGRYKGYEVGLTQITGGAYKGGVTADENNKAFLVNSAYSYNSALNAALAALKADYKAYYPNGNKEVQAIALYSKTGYFIRATSNNLPVTVPANSVYSFSVKLRVLSGKAFVRLYDYDIANVDKVGGVAKFTENKVDYVMQTEVTAASKKGGDGYTTVTFIVRTGNEAKDFELQFGFEGEGSMLIGKANKGATYSAANDYDSLADAFDPDYYTFEKTATHDKVVKYYKSESDAKKGKNPLKDDDGNVRKDVTTDTVVAYGYLKNDGSEETTKVVMLYRYDTIDCITYVIESDADESSSESTSDSTSSGSTSTASYAWLQIISIIIAVVLIAALVAVIIRMSTKNKKSKKSRKEGYYVKGYDKSKRYAGNGKNLNKNNVEAPDATDEAYDYGDDSEENGEKDDKGE